MKARIGYGFLAALLIAALLFVGYQDRQALEMEQAQYCGLVRDGKWPDFKGTFKRHCGGDDPPEFIEDLTK